VWSSGKGEPKRNPVQVQEMRIHDPRGSERGDQHRQSHFRVRSLAHW
jgi:hypothetical protein